MAISPENVASASTKTEAALALTITVGTSADRLMLVATTTIVGSEVTSMTWDAAGANQAFAKVASVAISADTQIELWKLVAPASVTGGIIDIAYAGGSHKAAIARSYYGVDQTTPHDTAQTATGLAGTDPGGTIASAAGDLVVDVIGTDGGAFAPVAGAGQTLVATVESASGGFGRLTAASEEAGATSVTMSWSHTGTDRDWGWIGLNLNASAGGTVVVGKALDARWSLRVLAGRSADVRWSIRALAARTAEMRWSLHAAVARALDARWSIHGLTTRMAEIRWAVRGLTGRTLGLRWSVRGLAVRMLDLQWSLRSLAGRTMNLLWQIMAAGQQTVPTQLKAMLMLSPVLDKAAMTFVARLAANVKTCSQEVQE